MFTRKNIVLAFIAGSLIDSSVYEMVDMKNEFGILYLITGLVSFYYSLKPQEK